MSSDESSNATAPSDRRDAVREKAQQVQAQQVRRHRLRITAVAASIVAVVAIAGVVVTWAVSSTAAKPQLDPTNLTDDGFVVTSVTGVGSEADAGVVDAAPEATETPEATTETADPADLSTVDIRVYVDYLSTGSSDFQVANVQQLTKWVDEGAATLTYHPVAMLTAKSNGTKYSLRAASAAACVATHSPESFFAFNNALLTEQPEIGTAGFTDEELASLAIATGASSPKIVRACIEDEEYAAWVKTATERALQGLPDTDDLTLTGTPMVLVNGSPYVGALDDPKEFAQFVLTLSSDAYYKATPTPTPTATK